MISSIIATLLAAMMIVVVVLAIFAFIRGEEDDMEQVAQDFFSAAKVLILCCIFFALSGCATPLTESEKEDKRWERAILKEDIETTTQWCNDNGGVLISRGDIRTRRDLRDAQCIPKAQVREMIRRMH